MNKEFNCGFVIEQHHRVDTTVQLTAFEQFCGRVQAVAVAFQAGRVPSQVDEWVHEGTVRLPRSGKNQTSTPGTIEFFRHFARHQLRFA
ncbi:hypothetical protein [Ralstonia sp. Ralssp135]|uniref:hypothetical protein n=1 Tax=Ralstonia sp. Ralssp135 TaxID=3243016 RepID=UPI0039AEC3C2